jgi:GWxTD domain-containing protein
MKKMLMSAVAFVSLIAAAPGARQQGGDDPLTVRAVRFFSPSNATTTIEGVCEVRLAALLRGVGQVSRYRVEIAVLDSAGLELQRSDWPREVPAALAHSAGATMVESFAFAAAPGNYRVRVKLTPETGTPVERVTDITAFAAQPPVSDLLLASNVRQSASDSEALAPGEVRRAGLVMRTAPAPRLTPSEAVLSWYAELYPRRGAASSGQLEASVIGAAGNTIVRAPAQAISVGPTGGATRGSIDLTGLPEGAYRLRLAIRVADTMMTSEAPFAMAPFSLAQVATAAPAEVETTDLFAEADEAKLDSLFAPLIYVAESSRDLGVYRTLTPDGKRRFLREFWSRRDPTPATADNPMRDRFYRGVQFANEQFREGGSGDIAGWNTDRGRIYLRNGHWDEILSRRAASPKPYEAWKFTRDRNRWYVFQDQTGLGHYTLIATNDRQEAGRQGWQRLLGGDGTRDVYQFLNLDLRDLQELNVNP